MFLARYPYRILENIIHNLSPAEGTVVEMERTRLIHAGTSYHIEKMVREYNSRGYLATQRDALFPIGNLQTVA